MDAGAGMRALVIVEIDGQVVLAAVMPHTLEISRDAVEVTGLEGFRRFIPGKAYLTLSGEIVEGIRWWDSWDDFYEDMGVRRSPEELSGEGVPRLPPTREEGS